MIVSVLESLRANLEKFSLTSVYTPITSVHYGGRYRTADSLTSDIGDEKPRQKKPFLIGISVGAVVDRIDKRLR